MDWVNSSSAAIGKVIALITRTLKSLFNKVRLHGVVENLPLVEGRALMDELRTMSG